MRLLIRFHPKENAFKVPYNHQYSLQGLIYSRMKLGNPGTAHLLAEKRLPHLFTYSLFLTKERQTLRGRDYFIGRESAEVIFSTPILEIGEALLNGLEKFPKVRLWGEKFMTEVKELKEPASFDGKKFSTLSPIAITVKKTINGRERTVDLGPDDGEFFEKLNQNLLWKASLLGRSARGTIELEILRKRSKRFEVKPGIFQVAWHLVFRAHGDEELLRIGYQAGFGEKNTIGFGAVKIIKEKH